MRLERWLGLEEHWLFLQRTQALAPNTKVAPNHQ